MTRSATVAHGFFDLGLDGGRHGLLRADPLFLTSHQATAKSRRIRTIVNGLNGGARVPASSSCFFSAAADAMELPSLAGRGKKRQRDGSKEAAGE